MSVSARSLLFPGMALATAGVVALSPTIVAPAVTLAPPAVDVPMVQIQDIQLAGIGRDIYNEITTFVQYTVSSAQYWIALVPVIGPPIADQVGINYFGLIQPVIANTVYVISDIISNPFNILGYATIYASQLGYIGYNWVSDQAEFFGLPPLPPIPAPLPLAAEKAPARGGAAAPSAAAAVEAAATVEAPAVDASTAEAAPVKAGAVRANRKAQSATPGADTPRPAAAVATAASDEGAAATGAESGSSSKAGASRGGASAR
jgi:hypothetical protein